MPNSTYKTLKLAKRLPGLGVWAMPPIDAILVSSRMFDVGCPEASKEPLDGNMIFYNEVRQERHLHYKVKMFFVEFFNEKQNRFL